MSRLIPFKLNAFDAVAAGQKAYTKLPNGPTYQEILIETNIPAAKIDKVTLDLGGMNQMGEIVEVLGSELVMIEKYKGVTVNEAGPTYTYVIALGSREAKSDPGQLVTGLVTLPTDNIILNVYLNSTLGTLTPATPFINGYASASAAQTQRSVIPMLKPHTIIVTSIGDNDYLNVTGDAGVELRRLYLSGGDISKVELWKDGVREYEETAEINEFMQLREERVPQAGKFIVDFVRRGWVLADTFKPQRRSELKLRMTIGTAENVRMLVESFKVLATPQR